MTEATGAPVVGGVAVALHGWRRFTGDIDIYSADLWATHEKLEAAGIRWDSDHREHVIVDVLELIRIVPLKKDFAAKLPKELRGAFKELVEQVHGPRRAVIPPREFWKVYGPASSAGAGRTLGRERARRRAKASVKP